jgi:hypothetical protein
LASDALQKKAQKQQKEADDVVRKAAIAYTRAQNKQKKELRAEGVQDRKAENKQGCIFNNTKSLDLQFPP